jgi:hypothetical protein
MKFAFAIKLLKRTVYSLERAYSGCVINGELSTDSTSAKLNRKRVKELKKAIKKLKK